MATKTCDKCGAKFEGETKEADKAYKQHQESFHPTPPRTGPAKQERKARARAARQSASAAPKSRPAETHQT
jgi:hypothetical protein